MCTISAETTTQGTPADTPQTVPTSTLTPEAAVDALRSLREQLGDVTPLTSAQRKALRRRAKASNPVLQASINLLGALDNVSQAVGQPAGDVRQLYDEANRWTAVEDEVRALLSGISGANLIRRERVALIAAQATGIGSQLARNPANAVLVPHLQEIKRLKSFTRRKKTAQAPGTPKVAGSATQVSQVPGTSGSHQA